MFEKLQKKVTAAGNHVEESDQEPGPSSLRKIELGWIHEGKQVRKRSGEGTRVFNISIDSTTKDLISHAKELFFPHGE